MTPQFGFPLNEINTEANRLINNHISSWISYHAALPFCTILFSYVPCSLAPRHPKPTLLISPGSRCSDVWKVMNRIGSSSSWWWLEVSWWLLKLGDTFARWVVTYITLNLHDTWQHIIFVFCLGSQIILISRQILTDHGRATITNCSMLRSHHWLFPGLLHPLGLHVQCWNHFASSAPTSWWKHILMVFLICLLISHLAMETGPFFSVAFFSCFPSALIALCLTAGHCQELGVRKI